MKVVINMEGINDEETDEIIEDILEHWDDEE